MIHWYSMLKRDSELAFSLSLRYTYDAIKIFTSKHISVEVIGYVWIHLLQNTEVNQLLLEQFVDFT